jgi:8-oxo-dGTP pyrophosphatase MutT (NUDIX family)
MIDLNDEAAKKQIADYMSRVEPPMPGPYRRPRDSATLILLDGPRVLLGKRNERHAFMPGKFVFPGGAVHPTDARMAAANELDADTERRLMHRLNRPSRARARALAMAAIRETYEETGLLIGKPDGGASAPTVAWKPFADAKLRPDLSTLTFVARAITPPGRPRRFDARFFVARRSDVGGEMQGIVGPDAELVELRWMSFAEAGDANLPLITRVVLAEIESRQKADAFARPPVPFYYYRHGRANREEIA